MADDNATIREVYDIVARIEAKVDAKLGDQDKRLRSLEKWRAWTLGFAAANIAGLGWLLGGKAGP